MIDPQSYEAVLRPDHGDADVDVKLLPDTGEAAVEAVQLPDPPIAVVPTDGEIEPPIVRHDPFAHMRGAPWMNRKLSPSGRAAAFLRRELGAFPALEGRDPNGADLGGIVKRTVDTMVPIFKRERATDHAYDVLREKRQARIARRRAEAGPVDDLDANIVKVSGGDVEPTLAQLDPEARNERIRSGKWATPTDDGDYLKSLEKYQGRKVRLPDGSLVPDPYSPTGSLMSPVEDLGSVARAGRSAGIAASQQGIAVAMLTPEKLGQHYEQVSELFRSALAQGGEFDYQRKAAVGGKDGFVQLRQFRNVSNFNVGLFMQQAGVPLWLTLEIAGGYAKEKSSNYRPDKPYGLDPQTKEFIEQGHAAGKSGMFD